MPKIHTDNSYCIEYTREELLAEAEELSQEYFNLSAKETLQKYKSGEIEFCDMPAQLHQCFFLLNDE